MMTKNISLIELCDSIIGERSFIDRYIAAFITPAGMPEEVLDNLERELTEVPHQGGDLQ